MGWNALNTIFASRTHIGIVMGRYTFIDHCDFCNIKIISAKIRPGSFEVVREKSSWKKFVETFAHAMKYNDSKLISFK